MKIEKISETKVRFILDKTDLSERGIKLSELAYGSDKTQKLFKEMMDKALTRFGFATTNIPLMVEAIPLASESIMIIITKIKDMDAIEKKFSLNDKSKEPALNQFFGGGILDDFENMMIDDAVEKPIKSGPRIYIYSFDLIDDVASLSKRLVSLQEGKSSLYKNDGLYFLVLENYRTNIDLIAKEYGTKHISDLVSKHYLVEHGEVVIKKQAIEILSKI